MLNKNRAAVLQIVFMKLISSGVQLTISNLSLIYTLGVAVVDTRM